MRNSTQLKTDVMKIYKALSIIALLPVLVVSCTKSTIQPTAAKQTSTPTANTTPIATQQAQDTVVVYHPGNSGAMGAAVPDQALAGNWTLISDSTSISHGANAAFDSRMKYTAQQGDYFNITSDGKITIKEGSNYQTIDCVETDSGNNSFELWYSQYPNVAVAGNGFIRAELLPPVVTTHSAIINTQIVGTMAIYTRQFVLKR
jgi:hypothetical protein